MVGTCGYERTLIVTRSAVSVNLDPNGPTALPAEAGHYGSPPSRGSDRGGWRQCERQYANRTSPTIERLMMSPNTCCWMSWFSRFVTFTIVVMRPPIHFTPKLPLTMV
jgi:hypothetical protein